MLKTAILLFAAGALAAPSSAASSTSSAPPATTSIYHRWSASKDNLTEINSQWSAWGLAKERIQDSIGFNFTLNAQGLFYVNYGDVQVKTGQPMEAAQFEQPPTSFIFSPSYDYLPQMTQHNYTLFFADAGAIRSEGGFGSNWLHFIMSDLVATDADKKDDDISALLTGGTQKLSYFGPDAPEKSGPHRYVFMLFEQPAVYNYTIDEESGSARGEPVIQIWEKTGLGQLVAANWFTYENGTADFAVYDPVVGEVEPYTPVSGLTWEPLSTAVSSAATSTGTSTKKDDHKEEESKTSQDPMTEIPPYLQSAINSAQASYSRAYNVETGNTTSSDASKIGAALGAVVLFGAAALLN